MASRIDSVEGRSKLKPRTPPYWHKLSTGCHLGFRKSGISDGSWLAQAYDPNSRKQTRKSLGKLDQYPANQRFDKAKKLAEEWFEHLGRGGSTQILSIKQACESYISALRESGKEKNANDTEARFNRWVYSDPIANQPLTKLTKKLFDEWRNRLAQTPVYITPHTDKTKTKQRAASSVNRDMAALRAALNSAYDHGYITNDLSWRVSLRATENTGGRRDTYIDRSQRIKLISKADSHLAIFLKCLSLVPLRPGALASLTAGQINSKHGVLSVGKDKAGRDRKIKLPNTTASFFSDLIKNKLPSAPLITRADGKAWDKDAWKRPIKEAAERAGLPPTVTAYTIRHSVITDLVTNGLDLLTVAQLSGTSVAMIEKHYGHYRADIAAKALAGLSL